MDVGARAADEEHRLPRGDAAVHLRRQDVAHELVAQGDEMGGRGDEEARQQLERQRPAAVERQAEVAQRRLHPIGLGARGVEPKPHAAGALAVVPAVALNESLVVVGDAEVPRVEQQRLAGQLGRRRQRFGPRRHRHRRRVALEHDPRRRDPLRQEALALVLPQHLEAVDASAQRHRPAVEDGERPRHPPHLRHQALGVEVGDAVGEPPAQQEVERHDEVDEEGRAAGEEHLVGAPQLAARRPEQAQVRSRRPQGAGAEVGAVVRARREAQDAQAPGPGRLLDERSAARGEPGQKHVLPGRRPLAREVEAVLPDRPEIRRQPVAEVDELVHGDYGGHVIPSAACAAAKRLPAAV